jgi:ketosteroid isomerase-like protein
MQPVQTPITGSEPLGDLTSPLQALAQFYAAFNRRDLHAMSRNWLQSADVVMHNPLGDMTRGWPEIQALYERLFNGPAKVYVEFYDYTIHTTNDIFYAVGRERGAVQVGAEHIVLAIRTSRVFQRVGGSWKQVHHHGSIDDPELLKRYQAAVLKP